METKCPAADEWIKKMWCVCVCVYTHTYIYIQWKIDSVLKNEWNFAICNKTNEAWGHYAKWTRPVTERQKLRNSTYKNLILIIDYLKSIKEWNVVASDQEEGQTRVTNKWA